MKTSAPLLLALFLGIMACNATDEAPELRVSSKNGMSSFSPHQGEMTWTGELSLEHPKFRMSVNGRATVFNGPALQHEPSSDPTSPKRKITARQQCISIIALGEVTIVRLENGKESAPLRGSRVVYIPGEDRLLIDGKEIPKPG